MEFGFGPVFRIVKTAEGYYDNAGTWVKAPVVPENTDYRLEETLDSRGNPKLSTGLVFAFGKTFTSGYLNLPVNIYYSPSPQLNSHVVGVMLGFTIAKRPRK
ncbi:MAG: hypothetical protein U5L96_18655 [Owenweeksia sp.]|nr:hypothetical protein [Owenweeksia sp.]